MLWAFSNIQDSTVSIKNKHIGLYFAVVVQKDDLINDNYGRLNSINVVIGQLLENIAKITTIQLPNIEEKQLKGTKMLEMATTTSCF